MTEDVLGLQKKIRCKSSVQYDLKDLNLPRVFILRKEKLPTYRKRDTCASTIGV